MIRNLILFWKNLNIEEKLLALYIIALSNMDFAAFTLHNKRILYADIICLFIFVIFMFRLLKGQERFGMTSLEAPLVVMLFLFLLSFLNSTDLISSFTELLGILYLIVLFIIIIRIIRAHGKLINFLYLWIITASIVSLIGLTVFFLAIINKNLNSNLFLLYTTMESMAHHFPRIDSLYANANMFFTYLHVSFIFAAILFLIESDWKRKLFVLICIMIILITSFFTGSRRFAGLLLSIFLILSLFGKGKVSSILKYATFSGFLLFFVAYLITSIWVIFPVKLARDESAKRIALTADYSYSMHFLSPVVSVAMAKEHPIIGIGLGTYNKYFKEYVDWEWLGSSFGFKAYPEYNKAVEEKSLNFDPHSLFLGVLAETGLLGLLGLLIVIIAYATSLLARIKKPRNLNLTKIIPGCILAGFVGFLLNAITMDVLTMRHFWFMLAVGLTCQKLEEPESRSGNNNVS